MKSATSPKKAKWTLPAHTVGIDLHPEEEAKLHAEKKPAYQVLVECNSGAIKLRILPARSSAASRSRIRTNSQRKRNSPSNQEEGTQALQRFGGGLKDTLGVEIFTEIPFPAEPYGTHAEFLEELEAQEKDEEPARRTCLTNGGFQTEATNKGEELRAESLAEVLTHTR